MQEKAVFSEVTNLAAAEAKWKAEGKILMVQDAINQYLEVRLL
ncbi:hypothetical protein [Paradesulfitobacterium ferrireducens]|nr:hypothetical protein [Paradesulfitobacterium ferrireducens]